MNLIEIAYTKLSILYENFREEGDSLFYMWKQNKKPHVVIAEDSC